jgi:K+ transporter
MSAATAESQPTHSYPALADLTLAALGVAYRDIGATTVVLLVDGLMVVGCEVKLPDGGWFPLLIGGLLFALMSTGAHGRQRLLRSVRSDGLKLADFLDQLAGSGIHRVPRTAVYAVASCPACMSSSAGTGRPNR